MERWLGGYAIAVATAILPMMSHQAAAKDYESLKKTLSFSVRIVALSPFLPSRPDDSGANRIHPRALPHASSSRIHALDRPRSPYMPSTAGPGSVKLIVPAFYSTRTTKTPSHYRFHVAGSEYRSEHRLFAILFKRVQNGGPALATALATFFDSSRLLIIFVSVWPARTLDIFRSLQRFLVRRHYGLACWFGNYYTVVTLHSRFLCRLSFLPS